MPSIALTGHRPTKLDGYDGTTPFYRRLQDELLRVALRALHSSEGALELHSGMALGADTVWADAIVTLKRVYPERVRFIAHVPMPQQPDRWPAPAQDHYRELLTQADEVRTYGTEYTSEVMQARNVGMIDAAETLIAVYDGSERGGTANAVHYARRIAKPIITLHPDRFRD
jgi:uncharacterized phage-like protein YoqJ